jgi:hypothetical protein
MRDAVAEYFHFFDCLIDVAGEFIGPFIPVQYVPHETKGFGVIGQKENTYGKDRDAEFIEHLEHIGRDGERLVPYKSDIRLHGNQIFHVGHALTKPAADNRQFLLGRPYVLLLSGIGCSPADHERSVDGV